MAHSHWVATNCLSKEDIMAYMDYQAPQQVNWQQPVNNLMQMAQFGEQQKMNELQRAKIERENAKEDKSNALAEQYGNEKDENKKGDIFKQMVAIDPQRAESMYNTFSKMDEKQYIDTQRQAEQLGKVSFGVIKDPSMMDKMFPTLPKSSQDQLLKMGYDPSTPMDENKAKLVQGIGQHFINMAQDTKTLADHAFKKEEAKTKQTFEAEQNALARATQKEVAQLGADKSVEVAEINERSHKYTADKNAELYKDGLKGLGLGGKASGIEIQAFKSAVETKINPLATPQDKAGAQVIIDSLNNKYGVTQGTENNITPTSRPPLNSFNK